MNWKVLEGNYTFVRVDTRSLFQRQIHRLSLVSSFSFAEDYGNALSKEKSRNSNDVESHLLIAINDYISTLIINRQ